MINGNLRQKIQEEIDIIDNEIGEEVINENYRTVLESVKNLGDGHDLNVLERHKLWKTLKHKFPKNLDAVSVEKRDKDGKIVTDHTELKQLYLKAYTQRLRNKPIKDKFEHIKELKEDLFNDRLKLSLEKKTKPWTMANLMSAIKLLKKNKARDPHGWANELFQDGVGGQQLKLLILHILNQMKDKNYESYCRSKRLQV